ncbi:four-helix bundle copper-binding protein [Pseudarthrobacter sp. NamE5]|uniref:four-helix bundle copper-binding protein n=1 Tax=Pseudarthrobacter sp. NamE5 TaxID=2576839 RepID=UPI00110A2C81|nr:four-helix bundle copper-binding protein [Pseudarthrobacter sp. NamE5]
MRHGRPSRTDGLAAGRRDGLRVFTATRKILSRHVAYAAGIARAAVQACRTAFRACAGECGEHASLQRHCEVCAKACRRCERACTELLTSLG